MTDGRLWLFYDGVTSYDARTGKDKEREKFKVNESGLALTEADPIVNDRYIFVSGRGRVRAIDRQTGDQVWKADDLGNAAEMVLVGDILYVRTGGQFTRLKDGETDEKGPFGVSAINASTGKTLWRYKGADKGLTNFVFADPKTIVFADRDDLITLDAATGKRTGKRSHKIDKAQFMLVNESGKAVVGGRNEIAAFDPFGGTEVWRARHTAPGRGVLRTVAGIALRAAAIYFRYGGLATSALGLARGGLNIGTAARSFRVSGLRSHLGNVDLASLASGAARSAVASRLYVYGSLANRADSLRRFSGLNITPGRVASRLAPSRADIQESIFDRLDPTRQIDKLGDLLLRRKRLAELRANNMYFYTELPRGGRGLLGVNVHTGRDERAIRVGDPDPRFVVDEELQLLYSADGKSLRAFPIN
jgi:outer membrane protein assembly factor BamB